MKSTICDFLLEIDREYTNALEGFRGDALFLRNDTTYTDHDKRHILLLWKGIAAPIRQVRQAIQASFWKNPPIFLSKSEWVIQYSLVVTYYNMISQLRQTFGHHEEFLRHYLDEATHDNYSTAARFIYHFRFYFLLHYPREFFLTLSDEVGEDLGPLFFRDPPRIFEENYDISFHKANIWYYIRHKFSFITYFFARYGGRIIQKISLSFFSSLPARSPGMDIHFISTLSPGDILLTRKNWIGTNLSIPGFWKHMSLYLGTGRDIQKLSFGGFDIQPDIHYYIESIGEGVRILPLQTLLDTNDYIAAVRPQLSKEKISQAIRSTFLLLGKEYDYSFNYYTDKSYICSTLVTKAYLPKYPGDEGIHISLVRIGLGMTYPPNNLVEKMFQEEYLGKSELEFISGIDASISEKKRIFFRKESFLHSRKRSRFSWLLP